MKKNQASNEINLLEFFLVIMNNKMKIFLIIILTIAIIFSFEIFRGNENKNIQTKFTTKLKAISMLQETQHYLDLNNIYVDSNKIELNRFSLFDLFMKIIDAEKKELIKNFDFINKKNYKDKQVYEVELDEILSSIKISLSENKKTEGTLVFISKNEDMANKWRDFLNTFEDTINKKTQKYLKEVINNKIRNAKIEQINKVKDIESEINASLKYYEINTKSRLSFLEEQAEIAREGNITNKISAYSPEANNSIHYNKSLYYLRGYIMIQKEIELIKKRKDPYLFAKNVTLLQARKLKIENDETIIRQEAKFNTTPIFNTDSFLAGSIESTSIQQIKNNPDFSTKKIIILAILIGFITGVFYVTISHSIRKAIIRDGRY